MRCSCDRGVSMREVWPSCVTMREVWPRDVAKWFVNEGGVAKGCGQVVCQ